MTATLLGAGEIRALAASLELQPTKKLGQNFVHDPNTIRRIVAAADLPPKSVVLEIGPGLGSLTLGLLEAGHSVLAVELDSRLATLLPQTIGEAASGERLTVWQGDAMKLAKSDFEPLREQPTALVANLPYNVSVPVLLHLLQLLPSLQSGLVLVQAEVAHRLAAQPGGKSYGIPSLKLAWYAQAQLAGQISRQVFWPVPNVDSELLAFRRRASEPGDAALRAKTFELIDTAFAQRRKTLRQALAGYFGGAPEAETALREAGIDPSARGEALEISDFVKMARLAR